MRVAYDARMALGQFRGMGSYLWRLIATQRHDFIGFCATGERDRDLHLRSNGFRNYLLWEQVSLPRRIREENIDIFVAPYNTSPLSLPDRVKLILVIHDLIFLERLPRSASLYQNAGRAYRRLIVPHAVQRADRVITISQFVGEQLRNRYTFNPEKLLIIPNTIELDWYCDPARPDVRDNYILLVSGEAPSKNLRRALEGCAGSRELRNYGCRVKIAGVKPKYHKAFREVARKFEIEQLIDFVGFIPRHELQQMYRKARLFLMPSLSEGFGIPLLEAMASGTPIIASNASSLPEVAGNAAKYFDPRSPQDIARCLDAALSCDTLRTRLQTAGYEQVRKYHPDNVSQQIQDFWSSVLV